MTVESQSASKLLFEVEIDLGGGRIAPISVRAGDDLAVVASNLTRRHGLSEQDERQIQRYLQQVSRKASAMRQGGS